ncbi:MAG: hypothetical protein JRI95_17110, partial [Deltaproteobacteria bacterium]|nr:hypothetical protein [Deltaproteobacteria bacterium]
QYQIFSTQEELRDDVLNLTFGWPLWLFDEIRDAEGLLEETRENNPVMYQTAFLLSRQIPAIREHQIKPLAESDAEMWFGVALAMQDIHFKGTRIGFNKERFPGGDLIQGTDLGERLSKAFNLFRKQGFSRRYEIFIRGEEERDSSSFRKQLEEGVAARQQALESEFRENRVTEEVYHKLGNYYQLAKHYAQRISLL